jgi:hypothetical protein
MNRWIVARNVDPIGPHRANPGEEFWLGFSPRPAQ